MKKCLTYMSRFWGPAKIWLVLWIIFIAVFKKNAFIMMALIYTANAMALSIYGADLAADMYFAYGRGDGRLTLSLPMSRKNIYDTRMYMAGGICLISLILSVFPFVKSGLFLEYFMSAGTLIFGHIICGLCIRKPHLHGIAGLPAFMLLIVQLVCDWVESIQYQFHQIEKNRPMLSAFMVLYIIMFAIDVYVWIRERKLFLGELKEGIKDTTEKRAVNNTRIKSKTDKEIEAHLKRKNRNEYILVVAIALIVALIPYFIIMYDRQHQYNAHDVGRYLSPEISNCGFRDIGEYDGLDVRLYDIDSASFYTENHETIGLEKALKSDLISIRDMCKYPFEHKQIMYENQKAENYIFETYQIIVTDTECIICPLNDIPEL